MASSTSRLPRRFGTGDPHLAVLHQRLKHIENVVSFLLQVQRPLVGGRGSDEQDFQRPVDVEAAVLSKQVGLADHRHPLRDAREKAHSGGRRISQGNSASSGGSRTSLILIPAIVRMAAWLVISKSVPTSPLKAALKSRLPKSSIVSSSRTGPEPISLTASSSV